MPYAAIVVLWLTVVAAPAVGAAELQTAPVSPPGNAAADGFGGVTRSWLDLQRSGRSAAPDRPMSGVVASRVYKRYLNSFEHPLPEFFGREPAAASGQ